MENTLKKLSEFQIEALKKGISFDIDLKYNYNTRQSATATVHMDYCTSGDIAQNYMFNTTFSSGISEQKKQERLDNIKYFIETICK